MTKRIHLSFNTEPAAQSLNSQPISNTNKKVNLTVLDKLSKSKSGALKRCREEKAPISPSPTKANPSIIDLFGVAFPGSPRSATKISGTSPSLRPEIIEDSSPSLPEAPKKRSTQTKLFADLKENEDFELPSPSTPKEKNLVASFASPVDDLSFSFLKRKAPHATPEELPTVEENSPSTSFLKRKKKTAASRLSLSPEARAPIARRPRILSPFETRLNTLKLNEFKLADGRECKVSYLDKGTFSNVYTLAGNQNPIISGVNNTTLVLKAFHGENSGFNERKLRGYLVNIIDNYNHCKALGLPVAEIYNAATAVQDGYIIQQKVDGKIDPLNASHRQQVQKFFNASVANNLTMDLLPDNFKVVNEKVVLIDFVEEPEERDFGVDPALEVTIFNKRVCGGWFSRFKKLEITTNQAAAFTMELSGNHYEEHIKGLVKDTEFAPPAMTALKNSEDRFE